MLNVGINIFIFQLQLITCFAKTMTQRYINYSVLSLVMSQKICIYTLFMLLLANLKNIKLLYLSMNGYILNTIFFGLINLIGFHFFNLLGILNFQKIYFYKNKGFGNMLLFFRYKTNNIKRQRSSTLGALKERKLT